MKIFGASIYIMKTTKINIFILAAVFTLSCIGDRSPEEMESSISSSDVLMRINRLCLEMPKPLDFRFIRKQFGGNSDTASIVFDYASSMASIQVGNFYSQWAKENGWNATGEIEHTTKYRQDEYTIRYKKTNQTVVIEFSQFGPANITISCKEKR